MRLNINSISILFIYLIVFIFPYEDILRIGGDILSISLLDVLILTGGLFIIKIVNAIRKMRMNHEKILIFSWIIFGGYVLLHVFYSIIIHDNYSIFRETAAIIVMILFLLLCNYSIKNYSHINNIKKIVIFGGVIVSIFAWLFSLGFIDLSFINPKHMYSRSFGENVAPFLKTSGIMPNTSVYTTFLILAFSFSLSGFLDNRGVFSKLWHVLLILILLMGVITPQSRAALLAIVFVIFLFLIIYYSITSNKYVKFVYLAIGFPIIFFLIYTLIEVAANKYEMIVALGSSVTKRFEQIEMSFNIIAENFLFGVGLGGYNLVTGTSLHLHNMYLKIFVELGFLGFALFSTIIYLSFKMLFVSFSNHDMQIKSLSLSLILALAGALVVLFFASGLTVFTLWLILGMVAPLYKLHTSH